MSPDWKYFATYQPTRLSRHAASGPVRITSHDTAQPAPALPRLATYDRLFQLFEAAALDMARSFGVVSAGDGGGDVSCDLLCLRLW